MKKVFAPNGNYIIVPDDRVMTFGLTKMQNESVGKVLPIKECELYVTDVPEDLIAISASAVIINAEKLSKSNAFSAINCLCQAKSRQNASNLFSSFPVSSFFPLSIRRVYQVIKAGIFNMLQIQNHPIELSEKPSINSVSFSIQSKEKTST